MKLICQDWELYDLSYKPTISVDSYTGKEFSDIKAISKSIRVFGTKDQLKNLSKKYNIDEIYSYNIIKKDSYWDGIVCGNLGKPTREEYNEKVKNRLKEYKKLYELNSNRALIINI